MNRRHWLRYLLCSPITHWAQASTPAGLQLPGDYASHPEQRIEWWYVTGAALAAGREFGFQITFFRNRVEGTQTMQSALAAKQLILAHAAVTDVKGQKLWHEQRLAREGFGAAQASTVDTDVRLRPWALNRVVQTSVPPSGMSLYQARIEAERFSLALEFKTTQPLLLHGPQALSRKGPGEQQFSHYYSEPQMRVSGRIAVQGQSFTIDAQDPGSRAWLDHEWSDDLMAPQAQGWDWMGLQFFDGASLMAFQMRRADGTALWDACTFRPATGQDQIAKPGQTQFKAGRVWRSPRTQISYPVEWQVHTLAGPLSVRAVIDDQELDGPTTGGAIYWEGLCHVHNAAGQWIGRGYLEMTGHGAALRF
jgi:predicted secreted hydrolase